MKGIEQLLEDIKADEELRNKFAAITDEAQVDASLAEAGYAVTSADLIAYAKEACGGLSDEELDAVAGGGTTTESVIDTVVSAGFGAVCL